MITPLIFRQAYTTRTATGVDTVTSTYDPRYFENPFFNATRFSTSPQNVQDNNGVSHVRAGAVSLVSALGEVRNVNGGDVNVGALSLTGIDGVYFDGQSNAGTYAGL